MNRRIEERNDVPMKGINRKRQLKRYYRKDREKTTIEIYKKKVKSKNDIKSIKEKRHKQDNNIKSVQW